MGRSEGGRLLQNSRWQGFAVPTMDDLGNCPTMEEYYNITERERGQRRSAMHAFFNAPPQNLNANWLAWPRFASAIHPHVVSALGGLRREMSKGANQILICNIVQIGIQDSEKVRFQVA